MHAVELLLLAGALVGAVAIAAARRLRRTRGLPRDVERLLEAVPGSLGDAVLVLGGGARIVRTNAAAAVLAGAPPAELVGKPLAVLGPDLPMLAKGLARGPVTALVSVAARSGPRRARAALLRVGPDLDVVVLRPEPPARPPPLPRRAPPAPERALPPDAGLAVAAAAREPLDRVARAASLLRLSAPPLGPRAAAALAAIEDGLADAEHRIAALATVSRPTARRSLDLAPLVEDVLGATQGMRLCADLAPARAHGDDRALRAALRELLRALAAAIPAEEEIAVAVRGPPGEPAVELAVAGAAPAGVGAIARALLAPHGARVEEEAVAGHGWRLRLTLPPAPADARTDAALV